MYAKLELLFGFTQNYLGCFIAVAATTPNQFDVELKRAQPFQFNDEKVPFLLHLVYSHSQAFSFIRLHAFATIYFIAWLHVNKVNMHFIKRTRALACKEFSTQLLHQTNVSFIWMPLFNLLFMCCVCLFDWMQSQVKASWVIACYLFWDIFHFSSAFHFECSTQMIIYFMQMYCRHRNECMHFL